MKDKQLLPELLLNDPNKYERIYPRPANDENGLEENPTDNAKETVIAQITDILDREECIRSRVFRELFLRGKERFAKVKNENQNARQLALLPAVIDELDEKTKAQLSEIIRAEINLLQGEIDLNKSSAAKLMRNAVLYAKQIGDRLLFAKWHLIKHGEYQNWVEENFGGGLSTARSYTRIAKFENWKKIAPKLFAGKLTLEQALALIRKSPPEKPPLDSRTKNLIKTLQINLHLHAKDWPERVLCGAAYDLEFMNLVANLAMRRHSRSAEDQEHLLIIRKNIRTAKTRAHLLSRWNHIEPFHL